jgi:hypothetical protein
VRKIREVLRPKAASTLYRQLAKADLLLIDDFGLAPLPDDAVRDLLEILDDRYDRRSTVVTSQLPLDQRHAASAASPGTRSTVSFGPASSPASSLAAGASFPRRDCRARRQVDHDHQLVARLYTIAPDGSSGSSPATTYLRRGRTVRARN